MREAITKLALRGFFKPFIGPPMGYGFQRRWANALSVVNPPARGVDYERIVLDGVDCEVITPRAEVVRTVVYVHGGGYVIGSPATQRAITSHLARAATARVIVPDYRLAPEHPWPAGLDDALAVCRAAAQRYGSYALAGDSAGGGMALCAAQRLRDDGGPQPDALVLISPWIDLSNSQPSHAERAERDPMLRGAWADENVRVYVAGQGEPEDARWSPLFGNQRGLPRTLIHVGSEEILHDDAVALDAAMRETGVPVTLTVFDGMWHEFHMHASTLPRAREAVGAIAAFLAD
ncbi:alpha/beta hydrolase [Algiphilus sp.]|uniref:alpha/beta hydrolase n=1 Tax=Algiphilus sp. TaxID=1872431 RepID=UPI0025C1A4F8|nr:alpha/beta hydrolase [Algiphilus sp.]MCK5769970.1 alpha/beta hydrolase [Algiphilus sp.]